MKLTTGHSTVAHRAPMKYVYFLHSTTTNRNTSSQLEDEPQQTFSRMVVIDGNNSLKRLDGVGKREVSDTRVFGESDYYLSEEFVNTFADEVRARPKEKPAVESEEEEPEGGEGEWVDEQHGDPTDGDDDPTLQECTDNWKAAAADGAKRMWDAFRESGYFVMACRHGFVLWVADMVRSGELYVSLSILI